MRPQGFLGRQFARQHSVALGVPANPNRWSDDDVLLGLSLLGADTSGNLIVGDAALRAWLQQKAATPTASAPSPPLAPEQLATTYLALAQQATSHSPAGASAAGAVSQVHHPAGFG